ncbi:prenyltransferase, UbiA family [marine gamma proteobacterium HTCC2148]|nr:prenyltransferase, UbiA family [marine gamma proteobacterium HTCC2148]
MDFQPSFGYPYSLTCSSCVLRIPMDGQNARLLQINIMENTPIAVDLDGTLVHTDTLHESLLLLVRKHPLSLFALPFWLLQGKAHFKQKLSALAKPDPASLPYNRELIGWLEEQRTAGRKLLLCTAADQQIANDVSEHLGIFERSLASGGKINMKGTAKREALGALFPDDGFSYVGDTEADLQVWEGAQSAVLVSNSQSLVESARLLCPVEKQFQAPKAALADFPKLLRVHQWAKNLLLFIPAVAAHQITDPSIIFTLALAFISFSLCSSSVYIANDLLDLESDRQHPRKCNRAFASGKASIASGIILAPALLLASAAIALLVSPAFAMTLLIYYCLTCAYSVVFKRIVLLDCLVLAGLYTLRVIAGAAAISLGVSFWLLAFSVFLFLSLAFVKRFVELQELTEKSGKQNLHGRGYSHNDMPFIQMLGVAAGFVSVLVLALYIDSSASEQLYRLPEMVWGAVAVVLFWVSWIWLKAHRGEMHDDPVVFAVTDKVSLACGLIFGAVVVIGTTGFNL